MLALDARAARVTWTVLLVLAAVASLYLIRRTLLLITLALLLAYLLGPVVNFLDRYLERWIPRELCMAVVYLSLLGLLGAAVSLIGSRVVQEAADLAGTIPRYVQNPGALAEIPLPAWLEPYRERGLAILREQFLAHGQELMGVVTDAGKHVVSALTNVIFVILIPILSFFMLKDNDAMRQGLVQQFTQGPVRDFAADVLSGVHDLLSQFMRAMVLLGLSTFLIFAIALGIFGVPYTLLLAFLAGIFEFVPVAGPLAAGVTIVAVAAFAGYQHLGWIVVFLIVYRLFLDYVLSPYLMGHGVELPPLAVIFGILAGEEMGGIAGMFLSIPVLATLRIIYVQYRRERVVAPS